MEIAAANSLHIVEIGDKPYVKSAFPEQTSFFSTRFDPAPADPAHGHDVFSVRNVATVWHLMGAADLIVCHPTFHSPWHWRWLSRALFDRRTLQGHFPFVRAFGPQMLRRPVPPPIAVIDSEDLPLINRNNFFLLDRCKVYFKRELPADHWRLFMKTGHPQLPTPRYRSIAKHQRRIDKIRPFSLGLPMFRENLLPATPLPKTADVFFAGIATGSSTVRARGFAELMALRQSGLTLDIPDRVLPTEEFYERCARAWLVWSPEGLGWDCFRHYEALACGSVPVINRQNIVRHKPLRHAEHAIYYDIEDDGLSEAIRSGLANKEKLRAMAEAGKTHVLANHTSQAVASYVVETTLGIDLSSGSMAGRTQSSKAGIDGASGSIAKRSQYAEFHLKSQ
jgi:hypothetical protein